MELEIRLACAAELRCIEGRAPKAMPLEILIDWQAIIVGMAPPFGGAMSAPAVQLLATARSSGRRILTAPILILDLPRRMAKSENGSLFWLGRRLEGELTPRAACLVVGYLLGLEDGI